MAASRVHDPIARAFFLSLVVLSLAAGAERSAAAVPARVTASDAQELVFSLELPPIDWRPLAPQGPDGEPVWQARLPGFGSLGMPGRPRLPRAGGWLIVPPGTTPRLEVIEEDWRAAPPGRRLALEPVSVMMDDPGLEGLREQLMLPAEGRELPRERIPAAVLADMARPDPALMPGPAVRLGEPVRWRGRRIASYTVLPLRADGEGLAGEVLHGGSWRVRFVPDAGAGKRTGAPERRAPSGKNDTRFAHFFLNGDLLAGLAAEGAGAGRPRPASVRPAAKGAPLGYPEVRIPVRRTELVRVRASELRSAGLLPEASVRHDQLRLYQRRYLPQLDEHDAGAPPYLEIEVPIRVVAGGELFDDDATFLFWGLRLRDDRAFTLEQGGVAYSVPAVGDTLEISNANNIYWLQLADPEPGDAWARMPEATLPAAAGEPEFSYRRTDHYDEAIAYREQIAAITDDRYYYNRDRDNEATVNLAFWSPVVAQAGAVLQAGIANVSTRARSYNLDLVRDAVPIATLPQFSSSSRSVLTYETSLPAAAITGDGFTLRLRYAGNDPWVNGYLDWVRVSYDARYEAPAGRLLFPGGDGVAVGHLRIPGFSTDDVGLIEVTDPRRPVFVTLADENIVADGDGFRLSLQVDQSAGPRQFYAAVRMTSNGVPDIRYGEAGLAVDPVVPTELNEAAADVLVVTHPEFRTAAEAWVEYRRSRAGADGLTFQVVEIQDLFDWYSGGLRDPWAIRRLVEHALADPAWGTWALVLVGSANENPRELGVLSGGRQWSRDWVPTHFHVQNAGGGLAPEVLASDKWFASQSADDPDFPDNASQPADLYVGRLPVHSPDELLRILSKIQQVESQAPGETWRRRGIFLADDAYSTGALGGGGSLWGNQGETAFETSEAYLAEAWTDNGGQVDLQADLVPLRTYMTDIYPPAGQTILLGEARSWCRQSGAPEALLAALGRGGILAHFQGHANHWLLTHETWFQDDRRTPVGTRDIDRLTNQGRPWLFCGMACHLGDFIQNVAGAGFSVDPGLGEKMLLWAEGGAVAVYASSGYEFLTANSNLSEAFIRRLTQQPPHATIDGRTVTSRWLLGELMWHAEADVLAQSNVPRYRQMVNQYLILGDPLLRLDAGPPQIAAELLGDGGGPLPELQADLVALDASGLRQVALRARDEAGIDRLLVHDSAGGDLTAPDVVDETPLQPGGNRQIVDYLLTLPVRPFPHDILVRVFDSASPLDGDGHALLTLGVRQEAAAVLAGTGEPLDPATFSFVIGEPVSLEVTVTSAAWLTDATTVAVDGENLEVADDSFTVVDNHTLRIRCTVTVPEESAKRRSDRGLNLTIDGYASYVPLEAGASPGGGALVRDLVSYPNPMREATRFVFATGLQGGRGRVRVWTVSGREVASVPFALAGGGREVVEWDGRDRYGDRLANGTYLYRVELQAGQDNARSGMQRLVIMR